MAASPPPEPAVVVYNNEIAVTMLVAASILVLLVWPTLECILWAYSRNVNKSLSDARRRSLQLFLMPIVGWAFTLLYNGLWGFRQPSLVDMRTSGASLFFAPAIYWLVIPLRVVAMIVGFMRMVVCVYGQPTISNGRIQMSLLQSTGGLNTAWNIKALLVIFTPFYPAFLYVIVNNFMMYHKRIDEDVWETNERAIMPYMSVLNFSLIAAGFFLTFLLWRKRSTLKPFDLDHTTYQLGYLVCYLTYTLYTIIQNFALLPRLITKGATTAERNRLFGNLGWVNFALIVGQCTMVVLLWMKGFNKARAQEHSNSSNNNSSSGKKTSGKTSVTKTNNSLSEKELQKSTKESIGSVSAYSLKDGMGTSHV